jgi:hypothetical protein
MRASSCCHTSWVANMDVWPHALVVEEIKGARDMAPPREAFYYYTARERGSHSWRPSRVHRSPPLSEAPRLTGGISVARPSPS